MAVPDRTARKSRDAFRSVCRSVPSVPPARRGGNSAALAAARAQPHRALAFGAGRGGAGDSRRQPRADAAPAGAEDRKPQVENPVALPVRRGDDLRRKIPAGGRLVGRFPLPAGYGREKPFGAEPLSGRVALVGDDVPAFEGPQEGDALLRHALLPLAARRYGRRLRRCRHPQLHPLFAAAGRDLRTDSRLGARGCRRGGQAQCRRVAAARRTQHPPPLSGGGDPDSRHDGPRLRRAVRFVPADVRFPERTPQFRIRGAAPQRVVGPQTAPVDELFRGGHSAARHPHHGRRRADESEQDPAKYARSGLPHGLPQAPGQRRASRRREIRRIAARAPRFAPACLPADARERRTGGDSARIPRESLGRRREAVHRPDPFPDALGGDARGRRGHPEDPFGGMAHHQPAGLHRGRFAPRTYRAPATGAQFAGRGVLLHLLGQGLRGEPRGFHAQQPFDAGAGRGEGLRTPDRRAGVGARRAAGRRTRHGGQTPPLHAQIPSAVPRHGPQRAESSGHRQEHDLPAGGPHARGASHSALRPRPHAPPQPDHRPHGRDIHRREQVGGRLPAADRQDG